VDVNFYAESKKTNNYYILISEPFNCLG